MVRLFGRGRSTTAVGALVNGSEALVDVLWPTPRLLVVGEGVIADALRALARYMEWSVAVSNDREHCVRELTSLTRADATVVLSHDLELAGPALKAALGGGAGYVGALGARRTQAARAHWLQDNGVVPSQVARIRGPAGLDLGARTPQETALSIVAEILAARAGSNGQPLRDRPGPVHLNGLHAEPPPQDDSPLRRPPT
jgi:xanthine dehydrogenase accessory factor